MNLPKVNAEDLIFSLDIGTRSIIGTVGIVKDKKFQILSEKYIEHSERAMVDGQIHDINLVAETVIKVKKELEKELGIILEKVNIAAAGRFLRTVAVKSEIELEEDKEINKEVVSSLELTAVKKAEEKINPQAEGKLYCVGYSVKSYFLNGYVISNLLAHKGDNIGVEIIATFLPRSVVDSLYSVMNKASLIVSNLTLEPIAAIEAAVPQNFRLLNLALVDIGAGTSDIAISSKESICAYGMVPTAGDEVTEVIAQAYLTDFNTAEYIKKQCTENEKVTYIDVLGLENEVSSEEIIKAITPTVEKISDEICKSIIELNGSKSPNAIFLVGGGAYTPKLKEFIGEKLNLPMQRIAIKGRDSVKECICINEDLGSIGVTVLGIALIAIKKSGNDFINVTLNDKVISLFNSRKHTVSDLIIHAGINPKLLMGRKGKSKRFIVNGIKRVAFGELPKNPIININDKVGNLESEIKDGDIVLIQYAENGREAAPKVLDYVNKLNTISFYLDDIIHNIEPVVFINKNITSIDSIIEDEDEVELFLPCTIGEYDKYYNNRDKGTYYLREKQVDYDYVIKEGDRIYKKQIEKNELFEEAGINLLEVCVDVLNEEEAVDVFNDDLNYDLNMKEDLDEFYKYNSDVKENLEHRTISQKDMGKRKFEINTKDHEKRDYEGFKEQQWKHQEEYINNGKNKNYKEEIDNNLIITEIIVNGKNIQLKNKKEYVFIDIFDFIDFDLSVVKGNLVLNLNGNKAQYHDKLKNGDKVEIYWDNSKSIVNNLKGR